MTENQRRRRSRNAKRSPSSKAGVGFEQLERRQLLNGVPSLLDPSFETPGEGSGSGAYAYQPQGTGWTFSGNSGIEANGSNWNAASAPTARRPHSCRAWVQANWERMANSARRSTSPPPVATSFSSRHRSGARPINPSASIWTARYSARTRQPAAAVGRRSTSASISRPPATTPSAWRRRSARAIKPRLSTICNCSPPARALLSRAIPASKPPAREPEAALTPTTRPAPPGPSAAPAASKPTAAPGTASRPPTECKPRSFRTWDRSANR